MKFVVSEITKITSTMSNNKVVFVDDVTGMGGCAVANNLIYNCSILEERKKFTFNNKLGKTEYMIIEPQHSEEQAVTNKVKKGSIQRTGECKPLGTWFDETGNYGINIKKKKEKLQFMISTTRNEAHPKNIGVLAVEARLKLAEVVVLQSIMYNAEAYHHYHDKELLELERVQHAILIGILELPGSTPYYPLLMETGWWLMSARLAYKKLMLYQNIITSDNKRVTKKLIQVQKEEGRATTWYSSIEREIHKYKIELEAASSIKSTWKKHVKEKIRIKMKKKSELNVVRCRKGELSRTMNTKRKIT